MSQAVLRDEFWTPDEAFNNLSQRYGPFTLDAAASALNTKCTKYWSEADDALSKDWCGVVWCNPPYRKILNWIQKAHQEVKNGNAKRVVMLLPSHTSTTWFHYALEHGTVEFIKGKLKFGGLPGVPFFGSVVVVFE